MSRSGSRGLELKASSTRRYLATLRAVLDFAEVDPNPARDTRVKLPREEQAVVDPPTAADVQTIIDRSPVPRRLPLRVLEQTGMRVGELAALEWGDVDETNLRFRVKQGKTAAARRWVAVPDWVMIEVAETCPREDRTPERRIFTGFSADVGAEKRKQHGCKGSHVFRDPNESDRVWAIFDWDEASWQSFTSDPEVPAIFQEAGFTQGPPKSAEFLRQHDA